MGCKPCAEKAKRARTEFLNKKTVKTSVNTTNTASYLEAVKKIKNK